MPGEQTQSEIVGPASRLRALPACLAFILFGIGMLALTMPGLLGFLQGMDRHVAIVALVPREAVGPPLAVLAFTLAGLTMSAPQAGRSTARRLVEQQRPRWTSWCLGLAFGAVLLTVAAIPMAEIAASAVMAGHDYVRCIAATGEHHPPMRWARAGVHCP